MNLSVGSIGTHSFDISSFHQKAQAKFEQLDTDGSGSVEFEEARSGSNNFELVEKAFAKFDKNGDGSISQDEKKAAVDDISEKISRFAARAQHQLSQFLLQIPDENQESRDGSLQNQSALTAYHRNAA